MVGITLGCGSGYCSPRGREKVGYSSRNKAKIVDVSCALGGNGQVHL